MIATGFNHVKTDRSTPANAPMQTPVDMSSYQRAADLTAAAQQRPTITPSPTITRRPPIEMPLSAPKAIAVGQNTGALQDDGAIDLNLELDVPAFLRRNEG